MNKVGRPKKQPHGIETAEVRDAPVQKQPWELDPKKLPKYPPGDKRNLKKEGP